MVIIHAKSLASCKCQSVCPCLGTRHMDNLAKDIKEPAKNIKPVLSRGTVYFAVEDGSNF